MFYIGFYDDQNAFIGLSWSRDGLNDWQRHPANPIIRPGLDPDAWDYKGVYKPFAIRENERWLLWYNGRRKNIEQIGLALHEGLIWILMVQPQNRLGQGYEKQGVYIYLLLGLVAGAVLLPHFLTYSRVPTRDAGVFLYIGQGILAGKIPYRDIWIIRDPSLLHQCPGLMIGQGNVWGVWILEFLSLYSAALLGYILLREAFW